ncbi:hypothetical protein K438DRAFT_2014443 [Mycena galopus ATCC 62051]|nr:hypothetical protein K438DRAFT_2014443 [Mycena galopus ATCC 62051]
MLAVTEPSQRRYKRASASHGLRPPVKKKDSKESLRKQVLLRCHRSAQQRRSESEDDHSRASSEVGLESFSGPNAEYLTPVPRRKRTHLPTAQRVIQDRIDELKRCMRMVHAKAWFLRHAAVLRHCPAPFRGNPKPYFAHRLRYLLWYKNRHVLDWEIELQTLLGAMRAPLWDKKYWHNSLSLVLDSIHVVIEAM